MDINEYKWYDRIEEPIRELVFLLRNNGFNTECSCGHEGNIQFQYILDGEIFDLHKLVSNYLYEKGKKIDFDITITLQVRDGNQYASMNLDLKS